MKINFVFLKIILNTDSCKHMAKISNIATNKNMLKEQMQPDAV